MCRMKKDGKKKWKVVRYLHQLFGGFGGEEKADLAPGVAVGSIGPGRTIQAALQDRGDIVATVICGDNYFVERTEQACEELIRLLVLYKPDIVFSGPAFNAGR
jgi:glycine reductase complex component B subunit gamma